MITLLLLLITLKQLVTTSNGTILASVKTNHHCKFKETLHINELAAASIECQSMSAVKSFSFNRTEAFLLSLGSSLDRQFPFERF